jgi:hypothetical protein
MIGPKAERSTGDGALLDGGLGATALTAGWLLAGGTLDGNELGISLADVNGVDEAALEIVAGALGAMDAA